jgi:hypothetical protein
MGRDRNDPPSSPAAEASSPAELPSDGETARAGAASRGGEALRQVSDAFPNEFPIVGVGASAGGLEAFTQLLKQLPADSGMAFVLIQHLDPTHTRFLREALAKATTMVISQPVDGTRVEPNHVYVIPPDADITMAGELLAVTPRKVDEPRPHLPIDLFLRSLAEERGSHAIGVVLSGTGSDGTEGLRAIKAENGIALAQEPTSAKFVEMPRSAVEAGVVDCALPIPELAQELVRLSRHPYLSASGVAQEAPPSTGDAAARASRRTTSSRWRVPGWSPACAWRSRKPRKRWPRWCGAGSRSIRTDSPGRAIWWCSPSQGRRTSRSPSSSCCSRRRAPARPRPVEAPPSTGAVDRTGSTRGVGSRRSSTSSWRRRNISSRSSKSTAGRTTTSGRPTRSSSRGTKSSRA